MNRWLKGFLGLLCLAFLVGGATAAWAGNEFQRPLNPDLKAVFDAIKVPATDINTQVRLLHKNDEAWYARWKLITEAKQTIDCTYYIIDKTIFGQSFLGLLRKKAREGVKIRLMVDGRVYRMPYMKGMPDKMQELAAEPNVTIKLFNPVSQSLLGALEDVKTLFASNHDKILIADGLTCIIGGRNIGPDYFGGKGEGAIIYRDTDIVMRGKYVAEHLKMAFDEEFNSLHTGAVKPDKINLESQSKRLDLAYMVMNRYLQGQGLIDVKKWNAEEDSKRIVEELNTEIKEFKAITAYSSYQMFHGDRVLPVKIIDKTSRLGSFNDITPMLVKFIDAAKYEVVIQNSYVVLTEAAEAAIKRASARGVKVIFHTNSGASTDAIFPQAFFMGDWVKLIKEAPSTHLYVAPTPNERLHSKTMVIDSQLTIVGSYNMDPLSEQMNSEVVGAIWSTDFGTMTRNRIQTDMGKVIEYTIKIDAKGEAKPAVGPEDHLDSKLIKKMNAIRKLQWLRPLI